MVVEPGCCLLYGGLAPPRLDSSPVSGYGAMLSIAGMASWVAGTYSRTNRSCRLAPAHQGMKIGCIGLWKGSGVVCATQPTPSWGQAPVRGS